MSERVACRRAGWTGSCRPVWAVVKFVLASLAAPIVSILVAWRASVNYERAKGMMRVFPHQLDALDVGRIPVPPANRVEWVPAQIDALVVSDLHRCIAGRRDWAREQGGIEIYEAMLDHYRDAGWHVIENGDTEDFWMVGGSAYGAAYDLARLAGATIPGRIGRRIRAHLYLGHFRRIRENNAGVYDRIARARGRRPLPPHDRQPRRRVPRRVPGGRAPPRGRCGAGGLARAPARRTRRGGRDPRPSDRRLERTRPRLPRSAGDVGRQHPERRADPRLPRAAPRPRRHRQPPVRSLPEPPADGEPALRGERQLRQPRRGAAVRRHRRGIGAHAVAVPRPHPRAAHAADLADRRALVALRELGHGLWLDMVTAIEWPGSEGPPFVPRAGGVGPRRRRGRAPRGAGRAHAVGRRSVSSTRSTTLEAAMASATGVAEAADATG